MKIIVVFLFWLTHLCIYGMPDMSFLELSSGRMAYRAVCSEVQNTIILLHMNSTSSRIFEKQLTSPLLTQQLFALDLLGHGQSENAHDPQRTYNFVGHAETVIEFMDKCGIKDPITLCGCSLGGHVAIEVLRLAPARVAGLFLSGAPPIDLTADGFAAGFKKFEGAQLMGKEESFTQEEAQKFVGMVWPDAPEPFIQDAMRTDGRARSLMIEHALRGDGVSQRETIENTSIPLAFVIGRSDVGINGDYIKGLSYRTPPKFHEIDSGHDTFFQHPEEFNRLLNDFVNSYTPKAE